MSIGISIGTGLAITAGAQAATSIYGAVKQSSAAKEASQQQQQAAKDAIAASNPLYAQALQIAQQQAAQGQAGLAPYAQQGAAGLTALSAFLGVPQGGGGAAPGSVGALSTAGQAAATPMSAAPVSARPPTAFAGPPIGTAVPRGAVAGGSAYAPAAGAAAGTAPPAGDVVHMQSPTGQLGWVPRARVADAIANGGTVVP